MRIFLSYASQDRPVAEAIHRALLEQGHDVFFDREDLPPGEEFHVRIRRAIEGSDLFVFLVSEEALDRGSYTLNEVEIAARIPGPASERFLPVLLRPTRFEQMPEIVKSVTLLESPGNLVAAVADAVHRIDAKRRRVRMARLAGAVGIVLAAAGTAWVLWPAGGLPAETTGSDGAPAVLVPAGVFVMGDDEAAPRREVHLDAFYIDRFEVTTARYAKFLAATASVRPPDGWESLDPGAGAELPVVGVDWADADSYCRWAGRRLPTEAQWEKAARGTDGRRFPWGDAAPDLERANFENTSPQAYDGGLARVGSHPAGASPYGVHDLAGNAAEWTADWHADGMPAGGARDPTGPATGTARVVRGGGRFDPGFRLVAALRMHGPPKLRAEDIGFRCARDAR